MHKETHQAAHRLLLLRLLEMRELAAIFAQAVAQRIESERIDAAAEGRQQKLWFYALSFHYEGGWWWPQHGLVKTFFVAPFSAFHNVRAPVGH